MFAAILISLVVGLAVGGFAGYRYGAKVVAEVKTELATIATDAERLGNAASLNISGRIKATAAKI
jgi:hypothetical protein